MSTERKKLLLINSIYLVFSSLQMQNNSCRPNYTMSYFAIWKGMPYKPSKVAAAKIFFSGVYVIVETCFNVFCSMW